MAAGIISAGYWGWCPGPIYARPFYAPAFVGFVGGFGFGFGFGFGGGVGWFPLGWGEPFHPWYHCGPGYWHNVNVRNTYIRNVNVHQRSTTTITLMLTTPTPSPPLRTTVSSMDSPFTTIV